MVVQVVAHATLIQDLGGQREEQLPTKKQLPAILAVRPRLRVAPILVVMVVRRRVVAVVVPATLRSLRYMTAQRPAVPVPVPKTKPVGLRMPVTVRTGE